MKYHRLLGTAKAERENTFRATHYMGSVSASAPLVLLLVTDGL